MSDKRKKTRIAIGLAVVFLILVGFPLISVYYLDSGIDYRKEQLAKLNKLGRIGDFTALDIDQNEYSLAEIKDHLVLLVSAKLACNSDNNATLQELYEKLKDQKGFIMMVIEDDINACNRFMNLYDGMLTLPLSPKNRQIIGKFKRHVPEGTAAFSALLIDREHEVRNSYDISDLDILEDLITHITILLPPAKD